MTASETAARKKELTENFTIEELADMYLKSEQQNTVEKVAKREENLRAQIQALEAENRKLESEIEERKKRETALKLKAADNEKRHQDDCIRINQLNVALDVVAEKYVRMKGLVENWSLGSASC